jgi:arylsulfatase A-like enzyme
MMQEDEHAGPVVQKSGATSKDGHLEDSVRERRGHARRHRPRVVMGGLNTIVVFTTDNGTEVFTWPGGQTPFAQSKGTVMEGGFRAPAMIRWPGNVPAGKVENGIISGLDWFPTLLAAAGNPNIVGELKRGKQLGGRTSSGWSTFLTRTWTSFPTLVVYGRPMTSYSLVSSTSGSPI